MTEIDLNTLDRRVAERLIKKGLLDEKAWEQHLASLPDLQEQAEPIATRFEPGVATTEPTGR
jgi:hypothetical protein